MELQRALDEARSSSNQLLARAQDSEAKNERLGVKLETSENDKQAMLQKMQGVYEYNGKRLSQLGLFFNFLSSDPVDGVSNQFEAVYESLNNLKVQIASNQVLVDIIV